MSMEPEERKVALPLARDVARHLRKRFIIRNAQTASTRTDRAQFVSERELIKEIMKALEVN